MIRPPGWLGAISEVSGADDAEGPGGRNRPLWVKPSRSPRRCIRLKRALRKKARCTALSLIKRWDFGTRSCVP